ncbi:RecQ family ATP-dependent DNA helicase [Rhodohalobacter sp. 8-1]|uniref:RecQ family ATP-dependent DNA helicase n=1 Tax=Rhodohalobacter sp. 8-1 TaxID=3131972 RepID=UPI0030EB551E
MNKLTLENARKKLQEVWGYPSFRPGQEEVISNVLQGQDTLVLFPTGGGKSLCYQVPSLLFEGMTLVISPLVALMQDQVDQLKKLGIRATFINSTLPGYETEQRMVNARNGMYRLLYVAPERLATDMWKHQMPQFNISLVAVDEAHCISEWGHSFRPSYRTIREELRDLPDSTRWIALTATATPEVKEDIQTNLEFSDPTIVAGGFGRDNLKWWVNETPQKQKMLMNAVTKASKKGSGIVYCSTRRDCEQWAGRFRREGINSEAYHAGLQSKTREKIQTDWIEGKTDVVVSTNAFGMGIDKPDCRFVVHETMPISLESYYQEAGRAGRDGQESFPVLIYKKGDAERAEKRIRRGYPDYETLKKVYNGICDELDLAVGSEMETAEPIDYKKIGKRTGLKESQISVSVRVLERLEVLEKTELYESKIGVHFTAGKHYIRSLIQESSSKKMQFLDLLFRQFGAESFNKMHFIDESYICEKLKVTSRQLEKALQVFASQDQILEYAKRGEQPLIRLMESRMGKLEIDHESAYHYRDVLLSKLGYMTQYIETDGCREQFLRTYFGETGTGRCGHCDNCLRSAGSDNVMLGQQEIDKIEALLADGDKTVGELKKGSGLSGKQVSRILKLLSREDQLIKVEEDGVRFGLKNKGEE